MKRARIYGNNKTEIGFYDSGTDDALELFNLFGYVPDKLLGWDLGVNDLLYLKEFRKNKKRKCKNKLDNEWEFSIEFQEEDEGKNFILFCAEMKGK